MLRYCCAARELGETNKLLRNQLKRDSLHSQPLACVTIFFFRKSLTEWLRDAFSHSHHRFTSSAFFSSSRDIAIVTTGLIKWRSTSSGMWRCVLGWGVTEVSNKFRAFIIEGKTVQSECFILEDAGIIYLSKRREPLTHRHSVTSQKTFDLNYTSVIPCNPSNSFFTSG